MIRLFQNKAIGRNLPLSQPSSSSLLPSYRIPLPSGLRCASSLSAIHRGKHRSQKTQFGSPSKEENQSWKERGKIRGKTNKLTEKALGGSSSIRQQSKLRKKLERKADKGDEEESGRQTRRKRFLNPEASFGKRSLVYHMKHGGLKDALSSVQITEPVKAASFRTLKPGNTKDKSPSDLDSAFRNAFAGRRVDDTAAPRPRARSSSTIRGRSQATARLLDKRAPVPRRVENHMVASGEKKRNLLSESRRKIGAQNGRSVLDNKWNSDAQSRDRFPEKSRNSTFPSRAPPPERNGDRLNGKYEPERRRDFGQSFPEHRRDGMPQRFDTVPNSSSEPREDYRHETKEDENSLWEQGPYSPSPRKPLMAMNIKFTTAASQFLYGKSVVKAALEQEKRKLYNLYIYGGENRKDARENEIISIMAERRGVPITIVPNGEQRLMDKMSMGRPHNGFVLETSPIPVLPITALGPLEESPDKLGFHVELDYQSKEEESINGKETFVARRNFTTPKPFVLLLNEILDPGNLGALLRTASYLGVDAVAITNRSSSTLTPVVLKSAAGAAEEVTIFAVDSPVSFIEKSKKAGWKSYAAVAPPERRLAQMHQEKFLSTDDVEQDRPLSSHPCILIMGNEGFGLPKPMKVAADYELSVPRFVQNSCVDSLNVSVAAGLLCHAFMKAPARKSYTKASTAEDDSGEHNSSEELKQDSMF